MTEPIKHYKVEDYEVLLCLLFLCACCASILFLPLGIVACIFTGLVSKNCTVYELTNITKLYIGMLLGTFKDTVLGRRFSFLYREVNNLSFHRVE